LISPEILVALSVLNVRIVPVSEPEKLANGRQIEFVVLDVDSLLV